MRAMSLRRNIPVLLLLLPALARSQTAQQKTTLVVEGYPGRAPVIQVNGKSYVEIESLARLTNGSVTFQANQITLKLAPSVANVVPAQTEQPAKLFRGF